MKVKYHTKFYYLLSVIIIAGCKQDTIQVSQDKIIQLLVTSDTTGIKADGQSVISLKATIPGNATEDFRNVTFIASTALGTFAGSASSANNVVRASSDGIAETSIKVGTTPGTFYISAQVGSGAQLYKTKDITITVHPLSFADKLKLSADNLQPVADGESLVTLTVTSHFETEKTIKLTTNLGVFAQSSTLNQYNLPLDDNGNGSTIFQISSQAQPHIITATFTDGTSATITLKPVISRPDTLLVEPSSLLLDTTGTAVVLKAFLLKTNSNAKVSIGTAVTYRAYQVTSTGKKTVGRFTGINAAISDLSGNIPAVNFYGDTKDFDKKLPIIVEAATLKNQTDSIHALVILTVK